MTDLEMTKRCAEKMGYDKYGWQTGGIVTGSNLPILMPDGRISYDPLHDDAQAMALVKKFNLSIFANFKVTAGTHGGIYYGKSPAHGVEAKDLNRAIVECVAKMEQSK